MIAPAHQSILKFFTVSHRTNFANQSTKRRIVKYGPLATRGSKVQRRPEQCPELSRPFLVCINLVVYGQGKPLRKSVE